MARSNRWLDGNLILAFYKTAGILMRCDVLESDVARYGAKERNPGANEHGYARDSEALNEPGLKKALNCDPTTQWRQISAAGAHCLSAPAAHNHLRVTARSSDC
jgi:hypothetical protein